MEARSTRLSALIGQETDLTTELLSLLQEEKTALVSMADDSIRLHTGRKVHLVEKLEALTRERMGLAQATPLSSLPPDAGRRLEHQLERLENMAKLCSTVNRDIGQLVNRRSQFLGNLLGKITGNTPGTDLTYGADGNAEQVFRSTSHIAL